MRDIYIDLSKDKYVSKVFGGYIGEHNETKIIIKLPPRMLTDDITKYQFVFKNSENKIQLDNVVDISDIDNGNVSALLTKSQTTRGYLMLGVTAVVERNGTIMRKAKTHSVFLKVRE